MHGESTVSVCANRLQCLTVSRLERKNSIKGHTQFAWHTSFRNEIASDKYSTADDSATIDRAQEATFSLLKRSLSSHI